MPRRAPIRQLALAVILAMFAAAAPAQEGINEDHEGTFSASVASRQAIADTIHVHEYLMTWVRHDARGRSECTADIAGEEESEAGTQLTTDPVTWKCSAGAQEPTVVEFDYERDRWEMHHQAGSPPFRILFARVGKKVWAEDLLPRAVQPPAAVADSVVRAVRALYVHVNSYPCAGRYDYGTITVCARGGTVGRVAFYDGAEAVSRRIEFTYDASGVLRFAYVQYRSPKEETFRLYFANDHLVHGLVSNETHTNAVWNPSQDEWSDTEQEMLQLGERCIALARTPYDSARDVGREVWRCEFRRE